MKEIIKLLNEHNIECVHTHNDFNLLHRNFFIDINDVTNCYHNESCGYIQILNKTIMVIVYYELEYAHVTAL